MRVLVTNDDGVGSEGLRTLVTAAIASGLVAPGPDLLVAAPHKERSGSSASLTVLESNGRLAVRQASLDGLPHVPCLAVQATPAFIVFAAFEGAFGPPPQLVLSGVNHGPNTGRAILHSGTVGAALTATTHGCPAVAFSAASSQGYRWDTVGTVGLRVLTWLRDRSQMPPIALNVNVPSVSQGDLRGIRHASLASYGAVQGRVGKTGEGFVTMTFDKIRPESQPGTDATLLASGWATVTTLAWPYEVDSAVLDGLTEDGAASPY